MASGSDGSGKKARMNAHRKTQAQKRAKARRARAKLGMAAASLGA